MGVRDYVRRIMGKTPQSSNTDSARTTPRISTDGPTPLDRVLRDIVELPDDWHSAGVCLQFPLRAMALHAPQRVMHSAETGCGKSTLLLSHLSEHHTVFTIDDTGLTNSLDRVTQSPLLRGAAVDFVVGPTQHTLPRHTFASPLQVVLIDGPHAYPFPELEYYFFYPHLDRGALLILDDIHIPNIFRLFAILREDAMFDLLGLAGTTAFFRRTSAPLFNPTGDGWWEQNYNRKRFPVIDFGDGYLPPDSPCSPAFERLIGAPVAAPTTKPQMPEST